MNKIVKLTIPGKLFLAGEYAVTTPGQPALIAAVDHGMTIEGTLKIPVPTTPASKVRPEPGPLGTVSIHSEQFEEPLQERFQTIASWSTEDIKESTWAFVKAALAIVVAEHPAWFKEEPTVELRIHSEMKTAEGKLGLGSSAAVTVAVVFALHRLFEGDKADKMTIFKEAAFAHFLVQASGSLGDIATSSHTGLIYYQAPAWIKKVNPRDMSVSDFRSLDWTNMAVKRLNWPANWQLHILATKEPASTKKALAKKLNRSELLPQSANAVQRAKSAFEQTDYQALKQALAKNQMALIEALPAEYLTARLTAFIELMNDFNLAGKVSGAGFGDNGFWLTQSPLTEEQESKVQEAGLSQIQTTIFED
ncbi:hypothetical protein G6R29_05605 [Fructobacillus sp. M2-14]|uniref:phosphomevalonate kinase n=1 Tax=Fructobacillus broussonetiae TaxID=2713173 RepID=A0ABS5R2B4_9LACO|nr:hypothetical protein [Fructobacillus broussonetiae]MBS9339095.1 hypothetical protein [Fructobacillus broussonetiae]